VGFWHACAGAFLAIAARMVHPNLDSHARDTVIIVGGKGSLSARYRQEVERNGFNFCYYEDRVPGKYNPARSKIALVIVMVTMISHPLMERARLLAGNETRVVYLKSPSLSSVRQTIETAKTQGNARL
jgi:hypothetical protein